MMISYALNYQLDFVGNEFVTPIDHYDEFYVNLLLDRSIYRPMCAHTCNLNPICIYLEEKCDSDCLVDNCIRWM